MPIVGHSLKVIRSCLRVPCKTDSIHCVALLHSMSGAKGCERKLPRTEVLLRLLFGFPRLGFVAFLSVAVFRWTGARELPWIGSGCPQGSISETQS